MTGEDLNSLRHDKLSDLRRRIIAKASFQGNAPLRFRCTGCDQLVFAPIVNGHRRVHWKHRSNAESRDRLCPYENTRGRSEDEINASIFRGRQESEEHRALVWLLHGLAAADPETEPGMPSPDTYYRPDPDEYGLFPDVRFKWRGRQIVIEAQLATIALLTIDKRRQRYERNDVALLWVMRRFDPAMIRASIFDVAADQNQVIFDLPDECVIAAKRDGRMRLRMWQRDGAGSFESATVELQAAIDKASPIPWHRDFKRRWIELAKGQNEADIGAETWMAFENEIRQHLGRPVISYIYDGEPHYLKIASILMAIESGTIVGYRFTNLKSVINATKARDAIRASGLFRVALAQYQPELSKDAGFKALFARNKQHANENVWEMWNRTSDVGTLASALFPDLELPPLS